MVTTTTKGIFQSDIIIRTALIEGLEEVRANPWQLDFIFASLINDELTRSTYGEKELDEARDWFINNDIPVSMAYRPDQPVTPLIAISLEDGNESATTLGDVHYETTEEIDATELVINPSPIVPSFTPASYDSSSGLVKLPSSITTDGIFEGMVIFDTVNSKGYTITEIVDDTSFKIAAGTKANFTKAIIVPASSLYLASLRSVEERETYRIDLYVSGNPTQLLYLYAIVKFCLYKYKQELYEARGFERSSFTSTGLRLFPGKTNAEIIFTRGFLLTGYVRQYWPHDIKPKIQGITVEPIKIKDGQTSPGGLETVAVSQGWQMEDDDFDGIGQQ